MRIRKTSQPSALPLDTAQVVDSYSTSTTDAYSCNQVNEMNTYSTTETRIGTWINGKPIYRKVISFSVTTGTTENSFNIPNYDDIWINVGKSFIKHSIRSMPLTRADYRSLSYQVGCVLAVDTNKIYISIGGDVFSGSATAYVTFEYTKTTD